MINWTEGDNPVLSSYNTSNGSQKKVKVKKKVMDNKAITMLSQILIQES